ncbi:MAG: RluA family pseudouridine synthase [Ruminococcus sp.]|nr:RluA family pseudouridine synthase [Ruminococcus sp.]
MPDKLIILPEEDGKKLGEVLRTRGFSRKLLCRLKHTESGMTRGGALIRTVDRVSCGDEISLASPGTSELEPSPELHAPVLYEDSEVIVFDKPAGMPVHPSIGHHDDTLGNLFAAKYPGAVFRPVSRLDSQTSGCVTVAKSQFAASRLQGKFSKRYLALCCGEPPAEGTIDAPIAREADSIIKRCVSPEGKPAQTRYRVLASDGRYSLCEVTPLTGRTHQIRVHFAHMGFPLAGDSLYGGSCGDIQRQALHCSEVSFLSPENGEKIRAVSPLPEDMARLTDYKEESE